MAKRISKSDEALAEKLRCVLMLVGWQGQLLRSMLDEAEGQPAGDRARPSGKASPARRARKQPTQRRRRTEPPRSR